MADVNLILQQARMLSAVERMRLIEALLKEVATEADADEIGVGVRGLHAWSDSTRGEDWSEFYPAVLRKRKVG